MRTIRVLLLALLVAAIAYAVYRYSGGQGLFNREGPKYILSDIYSLVVIPAADGQCEAAVAYREKHVIGTFVAEPIKHMTCREYYFHGEPASEYENIDIALVRLDSGEYHWILASELLVRL